MKVLLTSDLNLHSINGVSTSVRNLKKELEERGVQVRLLTLSETGKSYIEGNCYHVGSIPFEIYPDIRAALNPYRKYVDEMIAWKPDLIHSQCEFFTYTYVQRIARKCHCPIVHTYHTQYEHYTSYVLPGDMTKLVGAVMRIRLATADVVIAPSQKTRDYLAKENISKDIRIIPTGIDLARFQLEEEPGERQALLKKWKLPADAMVYGTVGRVAQEKNLRELLEIHQKLLKTHPQVTLMIVGDGAYMGQLKREIEELGLEGRVVLTGMVSPEEISSYYRLFRLFVSASSSETQGLTYIEALANGRPVLARKDGAIAHVVQEGENGYQYQSVEEAVQVLARLLDDQAYYQRLAQGAVASRPSFGTERFGQRVYQLYQELIHRDATPKLQKRRVAVRSLQSFKSFWHTTEAASWLDQLQSILHREQFRMEEKAKRQRKEKQS